MRKVYISYSTIDKPFVNWLVERLIRENIDVWYDELELNVGDIIKEKITEVLKLLVCF